MSEAATRFLVAAAAVVAAGVLLTRCADRLAQATGLGRALAGMLLLAGATSLPELAVDLSAVRRGSPDLAAGDLLGSSLVNLMILAVLDAAGLSRDKAFGPASKPHTPSALLAALMTAWVGLALAARGRSQWLGAGALLWALPPLYAFGLKASGRAGGGEDGGGRRGGWLRPAVGYAAAAAAILWAGPRLAESADAIVEATGMSRTFVGTTALALTTGLPEMVSTVAAYRLKAPELAVANIFGSNAFNMILFLPLDWAHAGSLLGDLDRGHGLTAFAVLIVSIAAPFCQLTRRKPRRYLDPTALGVVVLVLALLRLLSKVS